MGRRGVGRSGRLRVTVGTIAFAFCIAIALDMIGGAGGVGQALGASSTITVLGGDVRVRHVSGDVTAATDGDLLAAGDSIETAADGRAVVTFFEGSTVEIEPSSTLSVDTLSVEADGGTVVLMTQAVGRTWHVVTKLLTGSSRYEVRTPASTASVRGTEFEVQVDTSGGEPVATVVTTEGRVAHSAPDPARPGQTSEVVVTAGTQASARPGRPVEQPRPKPADQRTVTVRVEAPTSLVVDSLGRANGVRADGKVIAQTPGARVERRDGAVIVTLPNVPDGRIGTHVDGSKDVAVTTTVADEGADPIVVRDTARSTGSGQGKTGVDLEKSGKPAVRPITPPERSALPSPKPTPTPRLRAPGPSRATPQHPQGAAPATSDADRRIAPSATAHPPAERTSTPRPSRR